MCGRSRYCNGGASLPNTNWKEDLEASANLGTALQIGRHHEVTTIPVFMNVANPASIIVDMAATLGVDFLDAGGFTSRAEQAAARVNVAASEGGVEFAGLIFSYIYS